MWAARRWCKNRVSHTGHYFFISYQQVMSTAETESLIKTGKRKESQSPGKKTTNHHHIKIKKKQISHVEMRRRKKKKAE